MLVRWVTSKLRLLVPQSIQNMPPVFTRLSLPPGSIFEQPKDQAFSARIMVDLGSSCRAETTSLRWDPQICRSDILDGIMLMDGLPVSS